MFLIKYIQSLLSTLNADVSPNEIAAGVAMGAVMGLVPKSNLIALSLWALIMIFRINFSMATASVVIFTGVSQISDRWTEPFGYWLLTGVPALKPLWTWLYNLPIVPFTNFNHSVVLGNAATGVILFIPIFLAAKIGVIKYRTQWKDKILQWRIMQALKASKIVTTLFRWIPL